MKTSSHLVKRFLKISFVSLDLPNRRNTRHRRRGAHSTDLIRTVNTYSKLFAPNHSKHPNSLYRLVYHAHNIKLSNTYWALKSDALAHLYLRAPENKKAAKAAFY
jgi:hypothetical protein